MRKRKPIDRLDIKIISSLSRNGRMTKLQLSDLIALSPTPCWERMKKLEKSGIIRGYHADLDYRKLANVSFLRVEITILDFSTKKAAAFEELIHKMPEVIECDAVLGAVDYQLKIIYKDIEEYLELVNKIQDECDIQIDFRTFQISKSIKDSRTSDIEALCNKFFIDDK